jgi:hypothetical protein
MKVLFLIAFWGFLALQVRAQEQPSQARPPARLEILISNYHSTAPITGFGGLFYKTLHPGVQLGYEKAFSQQGRRTWLWRARGGFFYHRFIQTSIPLLGECLLQWRPGKSATSRFGLEGGLGLGYMHSFPLTRMYKLQDDGSYQRVYAAGRPQGTFALSAGVSYALDAAQRYRLLLRYQIALQTPFIKSYVPLLPYNILQIGFSYGLGAQTPATTTPTSSH